MFSYLFPSSSNRSPSSDPHPFSASLLSHFPTSGSIPPSLAPNPSPLDSFWTKHFTSPFSHQGEHEPLPTEADVVIIGSGLTGICAVDRLVDELIEMSETGEGTKFKIVVLEARDFCSGATARNGGHLTSSPLLSFATLSSEFGLEEAIRCVKLEQYSIDYIVETCRKEGWVHEVELRIGGGNLHMFETEEQLNHARFELNGAKKADQDLSGFGWLTAHQVFERYRATSKLGGLLIPGNNVYPLKFVSKLFERAQLRASRSNSVKLDLFTHCIVDSVERDEIKSEEGLERWNVRTNSKGTISAKHVLHCTNGYLSSVLPEFSTGPARIYPTRGQVLSVVPPSKQSPIPPYLEKPVNDSRGALRWPSYGNAFSAETPFDIYMFQRSSPWSSRREIILGGCRESSGLKGNYEFGQSFDGVGSVNEEVGRKLRRFLEWQFPRVFREEQYVDNEKAASWEADLEWTGIMGFREGGIPIIGPVYIEGQRQNGQWVAAGYSGHGMPRAPASGHLIASLVVQALLLESRHIATNGRKKLFELPDHFPRHYLTTSTGRPEVDAEVPGESEEDGWVVVEVPEVEVPRSR